MPNDALSVLQVLAGRLGRQPTLIELLNEMGHDPAGMAVQGVNDPGYAAHAQLGSSLLGAVPSDESLTAALRLDDLTAANPELLAMREEIVYRLLFGDLLGQAPGRPDVAGMPGMPPRGGLGPVRKQGRKAEQGTPEL